jgi:predicted short-subunit dehydrogenase-like oxidoreductase (DUF2520 family)
VKSFNIIGAGRLGQTLGKLLHDNHLVNIQSICNQSLSSAQAACDFMGAGTPVASLRQLLPADITLLAVPDNAIESVCQAWVGLPETVIFHASGACSSALLNSAKHQGVFTASVHPLKSFADPSQAYQTFNNTFCAIEGDSPALDLLSPLFEALGADLGIISAESKAQYHAACVMACGGLTALYASCEKMLIDSGVPAASVKKLLGPYMKQTIDNNTALGSARALTGPVARGDHQTVLAHEAVLSGEVLDLYRVLTRMQMLNRAD